MFPFEKYKIWELSLDLSQKIYALTNEFPPEEKFGMTSQLRRAANSVGANIAEGLSRFSEKEKARFIEISFGSLMEAAHFLFLARKLDFITIEDFDMIKPFILEISNKINALYKKFDK